MVDSPVVPDLEHLKRAYAAVSKAAVVTPLVEAPTVAALIGAERVFIKPESLQRTGSFKFRGAYWRLCCLSDEERARGVVAYSSGNFAQGLAAAGQILGIPVTIVMPIDAPAAKRDATAGYGARVEQTDHGNRAREEVASARAREIADIEGLTLLHPFDDPEIVAGQSGVGIEIVAQMEERGLAADVLLCQAGGGGLIGGTSLAMRYLSPETVVIAVEPERFNGMGASLRKGEQVAVPLTTPPSICDGLMARRPGDAPWAAVNEAGLKDALVVDDNEVRHAMRFAFERLKLVLEPSGAATLAALLSNKVEAADKIVVLVATGGNVGLQDFHRHAGA